MRFQLFSIATLQAARLSQAVYLENAEVMRNIEPTFEESLAQVNALVDAESENANLVEALSKVISSLNSSPPANAPSGKPDGEKKDEKKDEKKEDEKKPAATPAKKSGDAGTNIAITTATDQHINIFVPEDPSGKVTVKKTEGVKIVESDSDKADKNADVKKAIGDKIKAKLVHKAIKDDSDDSSSDSSDGHHKKIKKQQKKIKNAKAKSGKMKNALNHAAKNKKLAQTGAVAMTEEEILALAQIDEDDNELNLAQSEASSKSSSSSGSESDSDSKNGSSSSSGSDSDSNNA